MHDGFGDGSRKRCKVCGFSPVKIRSFERIEPFFACGLLDEVVVFLCNGGCSCWLTRVVFVLVELIPQIDMCGRTINQGVIVDVWWHVFRLSCCLCGDCGEQKEKLVGDIFPDLPVANGGNIFVRK